MSMRYKGGVISATAPATTTSYGVWTLTQQMQATGGGVWPTSPNAPTSVNAVPGNLSATVTFVAPSYTGYPAGITGYKATSTPGSFTTTGASSPLTVTGLTNGTSYTIAVQALNAAGYGTAGTSGSVTPVSPYFMGVIKLASDNLYPPQVFAQPVATNTSNMYFVGGDTSIGGALFNITTAGSLGISTLQTVPGATVFFDAVTVASSGNIYAGGYYSASGSNSWVIKFNSSGSIIWSINTQYLTYDVTGITTDSSENIYIAGSYTPYSTYGSTNSRYVLAKFNSSGAIQWQKQFGSSVDGYLSGNLVQYGSLVYGVCRHQDSTYQNFGTLVMLNSNDGSINSQIQFPSNTVFNCIVVSPSTGNLYISGQGSTGYSLLIKTDSSGALQWGQQCNVGYATTAVAIDSSENAYVLVQNNINNYTMLLVKYNSSGTIQWQRNISMPSTYQISSPSPAISANVTNGVCVNFGVYNSSATPSYFMFVALFPTDGSGSGSYTFNGGTFTYGASSASNTANSNTFSSASNSLTDTSRTVQSNSPSTAASGASLVKAAL